MASTYSALKIELIGTGEQSGTWGTTTNTNLGDAALGEAITGSADVAFSSADVTVTLTDTNASQTARNLRLNLTGTTGGARSLILGSGCQIEKLYLINNTCADAITVKNTTGTGVAVAAGKSTFVFNNGTNVVDAVTQFNGTIALASGVSGVLPIANGGTGATTLAAATIATQGYTTTATAAATTTLTVSSTQLQFFTGSTTQTVVLPVASTLTAGQRFEIHNNSSGSITVNSSGANLVATVLSNTTTVFTCILTSGTDAASWDADVQGFTTSLPVAQGGTGATTAPGANANIQTYTTTATAAGTTTLTNTSTYYQYFTGVTTQTVVLPVTSTLSLGWSFHIANNSTGNLSLQSSGLNAVATILPNTTAHVTCILTSGTTAASWDYGFTDFNTSVPVALGGTGTTSATAYAVLAGGTTSTGAFQSIASVGTSGQVLTSNGAGALPTFQAAAGGGFSGITVFTANGTFTIPTGKTTVKVTVVGGGGGGARGGTGDCCTRGNGGSSGMAIKYLTGLTPGNTLTVTRGGGGAGGTGSDPANGSAGGTSSVASGTQTITTISCTGGAAGTNVSQSGGGFNYAAGSLPTSGDLNLQGMNGVTSGSVSSSNFSTGAQNWPTTGATTSIAAINYGTGGFSNPSGNNGLAGSGGIIVFEY